MKKSFAYLLVVLMLASMLCACGMSEDKGVVGATPRPGQSTAINPSVVPDAIPSVIPSAKPTSEPSPYVKNPQVGDIEGSMTSPEANMGMKER